MTTANDYDVTLIVTRLQGRRQRSSRHVVRVPAYTAKDAAYQARLEARRTVHGGKMHTIGVAPAVKGGGK